LVIRKHTVSGCTLSMERLAMPLVRLSSGYLLHYHNRTQVPAARFDLPQNRVILPGEAVMLIPVNDSLQRNG
jgi:hypothetical protein